jgi:hypothetical protein
MTADRRHTRRTLIKLTLDEAGRGYLKDRLKAGGTILIVVVPDDEDVAATFFGAGSEPEGNRPRLVIEFGGMM